jgi:hypothetical protein
MGADHPAPAFISASMPLSSEQGLQLRGICALVANVPAMGVAGADRDNPQRRRKTAMLAHISAAMAALPRQRAMAVPSLRTARNSFRPLSRLRHR